MGVEAGWVALSDCDVWMGTSVMGLKRTGMWSGGGGGVRNDTDDFCKRTREPNPGITGPLHSPTHTGDGNRSLCLSVCPALSSP